MAVKGEDRIMRRSVLRSRWRERGEEKEKTKQRLPLFGLGISGGSLGHEPGLQLTCVL